MNQEVDWAELPIIKITERDREFARMILTGLGFDEEHKLTRGFLFYSIVEGEFVEAKHYQRYLDLLKSYLFATWPNIKNWDSLIEGKSVADLEWDPHLLAYKFLELGNKRLQKVAKN